MIGGMKMEKLSKRRFIGYLGRFTLINFLIYMIAGIIFMELAGYEEAFLSMGAFKLYRPLDSPILPVLVFTGQLIRGPLLALFLYPFHGKFIQDKRGWLLLFGLLFGLKVISPLWLRELYIPLNINQLMELIGVLQTGLPEIIVQTLVVSFLFFKWERRRYLKGIAVN